MKLILKSFGYGILCAVLAFILAAIVGDLLLNGLSLEGRVAAGLCSFIIIELSVCTGIILNEIRKNNKDEK